MRNQRILGIDYGLSSIGLALGIGGIVEPYKILPNILNHQIADESLTEISKIAEREGIDVVVIGMPYRNDKEAGHSKLIRKFAQELRNKVDENVKIEFVDESSTSKESMDIAIDAGISQRKRKSDHSIAAGLIIKRWWEENN